jgi:hypothetical protein
LTSSGDPCADFSAYPPADHTILDIRSRDGSVDHYFHFLLGFLPPLLQHQEAHQPSRKILIRSCGPFDAHLADLRLRNTIIIPDPELRRLAGSGLYDVDRKFGYDTPKAYDRQILYQVSEGVTLRGDSRNGWQLIQDGKPWSLPCRSRCDPTLMPLN